MLKMPNEMQSSDTKFAVEVLKFNKSFQQLKSDIAITKNVNSSFFIYLISFSAKICLFTSITPLLAKSFF